MIVKEVMTIAANHVHRHPEHIANFIARTNFRQFAINDFSYLSVLIVELDKCRIFFKIWHLSEYHIFNQGILHHAVDVLNQSVLACYHR